MSADERRPLTEDERARMQAARTYGRSCAGCGRALAGDETVWIERRPAVPSYGRRRLVYWWAPVGVECASPALLAASAGRAPERCVGCGRGVVYGPVARRGRAATCSKRCGSHVGRVADPTPPAIPPRPCAVCGEIYQPREARGRMCSQRCRDRARNRGGPNGARTRGGGRSEEPDSHRTLAHARRL